MADLEETDPLATSANGVETPLYFDRQVIRASDLTLDRASHDAELARMRRLLHGWGVVTGFVFLSKNEGSDSLAIGNGYGITPNGNEVYLTQIVEFKDLLKSMQVCCGPGQLTCDVIDEDERKRLEENAADGRIESWLVARPWHQDSDLRPGVPEGCAHPANAMMYARRCEGVRFDIVCSLEEPHRRTPPDCDQITSWMCKPKEDGFQPLVVPGEVAPELDFLVIAKLVARDGKLQVTYDDRRRLLPVGVLQDWVSSCMCAVKVPAATTVTTTAAPTSSTTTSTSTSSTTGTTPTPGGTIHIPHTSPDVTLIFTTPTPFFTPDFEPPTTRLPRPDDPVIREIGWPEYNATSLANGLPVADMTVIADQEKLASIGIDNPGTLILSDLDDVSLRTGIDKGRLQSMVDEVGDRQMLFNGLPM